MSSTCASSFQFVLAGLCCVYGNADFVLPAASFVFWCFAAEVWVLLSWMFLLCFFLSVFVFVAFLRNLFVFFRMFWFFCNAFWVFRELHSHCSDFPLENGNFPRKSFSTRSSECFVTVSGRTKWKRLMKISSLWSLTAAYVWGRNSSFFFTNCFTQSMGGKRICFSVCFWGFVFFLL